MLCVASGFRGLVKDPGTEGTVHYTALFLLPSPPNLSASQVVLVVKNLPAVQKIRETCVQSLGWEDLLGEEMATSSSILVWKIPWTGEPVGLYSMVPQRVEQD